MRVLAFLAVIACLLAVLCAGVLSVLRDLLVRGIHAPADCREFSRSDIEQPAGNLAESMRRHEPRAIT